MKKILKTKMKIMMMQSPPKEFQSLLNSYMTGLRDIKNHEAWPYIKRVHGHENINQIFLKKLNGVKI